MGLMPIIFTALGIFIISAVVFLLVSYILYKVRPKQKPYAEINVVKPLTESGKAYYAVPVYNTPVRNPRQRPTPRPKTNYRNMSRFEILNVQKPVYMQNAEQRNLRPVLEHVPNNIYEYYSNNYNESGFRAVTP